MLSPRSIKKGLNKLLKNQNNNKIDRKILKGLVNAEDPDAEEFYGIIKTLVKPIK